jgi:hypothetical protein
MHNVPRGAETHFKVVVVSSVFEGMSLIKRHRDVNATLKEEIDGMLTFLTTVELDQPHVRGQITFVRVTAGDASLLDCKRFCGAWCSR